MQLGARPPSGSVRKHPVCVATSLTICRNWSLGVGCTGSASTTGLRAKLAANLADDDRVPSLAFESLLNRSYSSMRCSSLEPNLLYLVDFPNCAHSTQRHMVQRGARAIGEWPSDPCAYIEATDGTLSSMDAFIESPFNDGVVRINASAPLKMV